MKRRWFVVLSLLIGLSLWLTPSLLTTGKFNFASNTQAATTATIAPAVPQVSKVDPPNWWLKHTINPVQLLIRGSNLQNATLNTNQPGFKILRATSNANGNYLIAWKLILKRPPPEKFL
jgi:hypothetical protein